MPAAYTVQKLPNEPIILSSLSSEYSVSRDMPESDEASRAILNATNEPLFIVTDATRISFNFEDILTAATQGARGTDPLWHHPMMRELILVTPMTMIKTVARGLNSRLFGHLAISVFETLDEAMAYCRNKITADSEPK